jgi:hypothetical protein
MKQGFLPTIEVQDVLFQNYGNRVTSAIHFADLKFAYFNSFTARKS